VVYNEAFPSKKTAYHRERQVKQAMPEIIEDTHPESYRE
jgi:predicted GIY-YIG superfamily endonuclease